MQIDDQDILVSYDVLSHFTNIPVDEIIKILAEKAFNDNWFNKVCDLSITKTDLIELVRGCCKKLALPILSKSIQASGRGCHGFSPQATVTAIIIFICKLYQRKIDKPKQDACFL